MDETPIATRTAGRAIAAPLMKEMAAGASWAMAAHVGLIATTTTDDILMVYGDNGVGVRKTLCDARRYRQTIVVRETICLRSYAGHTQMGKKQNNRYNPMEFNQFNYL